MTIKEALTQAWERTVLITVGVALIMGYVWYVDTAMMVRGDASDIMAIRPHASGTVDFVIDKHKCVEHQSKGPNDYPSGVVYQTKDGHAHYSTKPAIIGKALDEGLGGKDWPSHTVNIFCK